MRVRRVLALTLGLLLIPSGVAAAADLHTPHEGTAVVCDGDVRWHFVHNQVSPSDATVGELTATFSGAGTVTVEAYKVLRSVRHYEVVTSGDTLLTASDTIAGGKLVLSDADCLPGTPPPPPTECVAGDTVVVTWPGVRLGFTNVAGLQETASTNVSLLPGTYSVELTSYDETHGPSNPHPEQDAEQWYVALYKDSALVDTTGTISDLPELDDSLTESVGTVTLSDGADVAVATHALAGLDYSAYWGSPESVEPTQAVFTCL